MTVYWQSLNTPSRCHIVDDDNKSKRVGSGSHYLLNQSNWDIEEIASLDLQYTDTVQITEISLIKHTICIVFFDKFPP